jgi:hypothetical protein
MMGAVSAFVANRLRPRGLDGSVMVGLATAGVSIVSILLIAIEGLACICEFTTGAFVEPITKWEEPETLAFDVTRQPAPLQEWSPYSRVYAPHLEGLFQTTHGEFRLVRLEGGHTRLEGRTWYSLDMAPATYWTTIADAIVHAIHRRVLDHVKARAEGR